MRWTQTTEERFWSKVSGGDVEECWEWTGYRTRGYGTFTFSTTHRSIGAHRLAYEFMIGPIPSGLSLDHLCRNPGCVNPYHLDPVTQLVNVRRGISCRATDEVCANGHPWSPETWSAGRGRHLRACRTCAASTRHGCRAESRHAVRQAAAALGVSVKAYRRQHGESGRKARAIIADLVAVAA